MRNTTLQVGEIVNTHGLRGEVKIVPWLDVPEDFERLKTVYADIAGKKETFTVKSVKYQKANIIVKFAEVPDIDKIQFYNSFFTRSTDDAVPKHSLHH